MSIEALLKQLPEPDGAAPGRVLDRFRSSRRAPSYRRSLAAGAVILVAACAALVLWPETTRSVSVTSAGPTSTSWSPTVSITSAGDGRVSGTNKNVDIDWQWGVLDVSVEPQTGTRVLLRSDEGTVAVVGTVYRVERDSLGLSIAVSRGTVQVNCVDGWSGLVTPESGPHTCLPVSAGGLLSRADTLEAGGSGPDLVLSALNRGIAVAQPDSAMYGELLVRRMNIHARGGFNAAALADADQYISSGQFTRRPEVLRTAGALLMASDGCDSAARYLRPLAGVGGSQDMLVWASCLSASDHQAAVQLSLAALHDAQHIDASWLVWAHAFLGDQ